MPSITIEGAHERMLESEAKAGVKWMHMRQGEYLFCNWSKHVQLYIYSSLFALKSW